jgi:hypothetical protein
MSRKHTLNLESRRNLGDEVGDIRRKAGKPARFKAIVQKQEKSLDSVTANIFCPTKPFVL